MTEQRAYVLGSGDAEIARLDDQAQGIAGATEAVLRAAGIRGDMRVLDLGTGLGHVALMVGGLLGPGGSVVGVDQDERLLEIAEQRRAAAGAENVGFLRGDARTFTAGEPFDAIVARLLLFHLPDREAVIGHWLEYLRPGGTMVLVEFDSGAARAEPEVPLLTAAGRWIEAAFRAVGADSRVGARAGELLRRAGLTDVATFGIVSYFGPADRTAIAMIAGVVRALAPQIVAHGIAGEEELGADTFEARVAAQVVERDAVVTPPAVVGAWGARPPA